MRILGYFSINAIRHLAMLNELFGIFVQPSRNIIDGFCNCPLFQFVFPYDSSFPAPSFERRQAAPITSRVCFELLGPEFGSGSRRRC